MDAMRTAREVENAISNYIFKDKKVPKEIAV